MPVQTKKSGIVARLGNRLKQAHKEHQHDEIKFSTFGDLPPGMSGIARLVDVKFDQVKAGKDNAGEYFFYVAGAVVSPEVFTDKTGTEHLVKGLRTSVIENMFDTPGRSRETLSQHWDFVLNELRKLGIEPGDVDDITDEVIEGWCKALKEIAPTFRFRTWAGEKQTTGQYAGKDPRTQHVWLGLVDFNGATGGGTDTQDDSGIPPSVNGRQHEDEAPSASDSGASGDMDADTVEEAAGDEVDLEALMELAKGESDAAGVAQNKLLDIAIGVGIPEAEATTTDTWEELLELIRAAQGGGKEGEAEPESDEPEVGNVARYKMLDAKTGKPGRKAVEVELLTVDKAKKTVTLKSLDTQKPVMDAKTKKAIQVPWAELEFTA